MFERPAQYQTGAAERAVLDADRPMVLFGDSTNNCQAKTCSTTMPGSAGVNTREWLERSLTLVRWNTEAVIIDDDEEVDTVARAPDVDGAVRVTTGILDDVRQGTSQIVFVDLRAP